MTGAYVASYVWDAASNLVGEQVSDDLDTNLAGDGRTVVRTVDAVNRITSVVTDFGQFPEVHTTTLALSYDGRSNRTGEVTTRTTGSTTHVLNRVSFTYDSREQVTGGHDTGDNQNQARDDVVTTWARDGLGRALSVVEGGVCQRRANLDPFLLIEL